MGVLATILAVCDPKPLVQRWGRSLQNGIMSEVRCYFSHQSDLVERRGKCIYHLRGGGHCRIRGVSDLTVAGLPCQPFSLQRGDRNVCPAQKHPSFIVILEFVRYIRASRTNGGVIEEVMGFAFEIQDSAFIPTHKIPEKLKSWLHWLMAQLKAAGHAVKVLVLKSIVFCD